MARPNRIVVNDQESESGSLIDSDSDSDSWLVATTPNDSDSDSAPMLVVFHICGTYGYLNLYPPQTCIRYVMLLTSLNIFLHVHQLVLVLATVFSFSA